MVFLPALQADERTPAAQSYIHSQSNEWRCRGQLRDKCCHIFTKGVPAGRQDKDLVAGNIPNAGIQGDLPPHRLDFRRRRQRQRRGGGW
jgi:hypothetical protein